jgi:hypothetical protein
MTDTRYLLMVTVPLDNADDLWDSLSDVCEETDAIAVRMVVDGKPLLTSREALKEYSLSREAAEYANAKRLADELGHAYDTLHRLTPDSQDVGRIADLLRRVGRL